MKEITVTVAKPERSRPFRARPRIAPTGWEDSRPCHALGRRRAPLDMQVSACLYIGKSLLAYRVMPERRDTDLLFKALADPSRRKLLDLLHAHDGRTLNELCEHLDMTRQGVTQHLDVLEAANLVATVRRGREKLHFLNPVPLQEIYERWIAKFEKPRLKALHDLKRRLEKAK
ncbi:MAG TPA: metalloregulator ArsR/SmtB family transcription factor [Polyangiaceae bacterium]|nr:metalloregulator ArsR/SmtB family transcription factor [Polyangiaceae bacterium]